MKRSKLFKRVGAVLLAAAMLLLCGCGAEEKTGPAEEVNTDPVDLDIKTDALFFGRTYDKAGVRWMNWSGSGFSVRFQGSGLAAEFYSNAPDAKNMAYLKIYVDGQEQEDVRLDTDVQTVMLAENLDPTAEHIVEVRKRTNARSSTAGLSRLVLMDGKVLEPEKPKERLIEFVGDSLTVGYMAAKDGKTATAWSTMTEDVTGTYCPQVAKAFDAEYQVVAISGRGVVRNNGGDAKIVFPEIYKMLDIYNNPDKEYDFATQPDVIVINLGSNDESASNKDLSPKTFQKGMKAFLEQVRASNPNAQILCAYGMVRTGLSKNIEQAVNELRDAGDQNIHYLQLAKCQKWELNLNHTVRSAYEPHGEAIIEKIKEITGW